MQLALAVGIALSAKLWHMTKTQALERSIQADIQSKKGLTQAQRDLIIKTKASPVTASTIVSDSLTTGSLNSALITLTPNPNPTASAILDLTYTLQLFTSAEPLTITWPNGTVSGQWLVLANQGSAVVKFMGSVVDALGRGQPGISLAPGQGSMFLWSGSAWMCMVTGFAFAPKT